MYLFFKCPLCYNLTHKNETIKLYASEQNVVFCCPVCKNSNNDSNNFFYCLKCGHILCNNCINLILFYNNKNNNFLINESIYNRLYKISKLLVRTLRYSNYSFILINNNIISAPIIDLFNVLNKHIVTPPIDLSDIYQIINNFIYKSGRKRFGITTINNIEYIDTDTLNNEF